MASNNIARLGVVLGLDTAEFSASVDKAIAQNKKLKNEITKDSNAAVAMLAELKYATDDYGKTLTKVALIQREIDGGRAAFATEDMKTKLLAQAAAYDAVAAAAQNAGKASGKMSEWQKQGLMYQTTDFVTQVASGQNVMIAALQQGGQLKDQMGGFIPMLKMLGGLLFTVEAAFVAVGAAAALVGFAMYKGQKEVEEFNKQLVLTGNYSKVTIDDFYKMSVTLSNTTKGTVGDAKDILNAMIQSGQFTYQTFDSVSKVIQKFAELSDLTSKQAADKLIPSLDGTASSALQLTKQYDFLTLAQYKHIEALNRQGKTQEAIKETADLLSASFNKNQVELGYINQMLNSGAKLWSGWWEAAMNWGKPETLQDKLKKVEEQIISMGSRQPLRHAPDPNSSIDNAWLAWQAKRNELLEQKASIQEQIRLKGKQTGQEGQKDLIKDYAGGGGLERVLQLQHQIEAAKRDAKYIALLSWQDEEHKIEEEGNQKLEELYSNYLFDVNGKDRVFAGLRYKLLVEETAKEMATTDAKREAFRDKERIANIDAAIKEREDRQKIADEEEKIKFERIQKEVDYYDKAKIAADIEKGNLKTKIEMIGLTDKQVKLAEVQLQYQRDLVELEKAGLSGNSAMLADAAAKRDDAFAIIELGDQLKNLQEINDTVFKDMTDAMDKFIETGKISFADLAQSIIKDLLKVQLKMAATNFWGSMGGSGGVLNAALSLFGFADGGDPPVNQVSMVGEKGPELFVPKTAGTIIPNDKLSNMGGTTTNNVYNINAIDTKSFEERILGSSRAVWAANAYGAKSVAVGRGRT